MIDWGGGGDMAVVAAVLVGGCGGDAVGGSSIGGSGVESRGVELVNVL